MLNLCANNYLGLAQHPEVNAAAHGACNDGAMAWPRCALSAAPRPCTSNSRRALSAFLGTEDTILYPSCFDANGGLFETLLGEEDAVISDELNHASIIDGIRLCKARRFRYRNNDMADLEAQLQAADAAGARFKLITTDGVFSMDGYIARLDEICDLADKLRCPGAFRRLPRHRLYRRQRPRHPRIARLYGPGGYHHRHPGQGPGRRQRRLHRGATGDRRPAAPALAALPVFQHRGAAGGGRRHQGY